ncbi:hypothetical protein [Endozoicomonas arenosclerae]|uniref:hypothetical protein n=1 Tax=Endozoicomonas arenosclerae TaxID=1633495 RepID=UPI000A55A311|nr:hypothetical protein [Endozoicomonas arenosclerae]
MIGKKTVKVLPVILALSIFSVKAEIKTTDDAVPENLHVYNASGDVYVDHLVDECPTGRYYINRSHPAFETIISILISAQISGKEVKLRYDECRNNGSQGNVVGVYLN